MDSPPLIKSMALIVTHLDEVYWLQLKMRMVTFPRLFLWEKRESGQKTFAFLKTKNRIEQFFQGHILCLPKTVELLNENDGVDFTASTNGLFATFPPNKIDCPKICVVFVASFSSPVIAKNGDLYSELYSKEL